MSLSVSHLWRSVHTIVLHDLNWKPAVLEQRIRLLDRVGSDASRLHLPVDIFIRYSADSYDEYSTHVFLNELSCKG